MSKNTVGIIGAGTMGAGIAQVAAAAGWTVELMDVDAETARAAIEGIGKRFDRNVEKGRMSADERDAANARLLIATSGACLSGADLVIEAIVEDLDIKTAVLGGVLADLRDDAIIATNTSSLSVTALGESLDAAHRVVGMHFFNPAPLMKLVEVVAGRDTDARVVDRVAEIGASWGKKIARAADVPGFIVNHVARPYYLEAFRIVEDGYAAPDVIDATMKRLGGFRMGPLELTDLIGQDVNTATTRSVWSQLDEPPLLAPSALQEELARRGDLGRKSGRGVYDHTGETPVVALDIERRDIAWTDQLRTAVDAFASAATDETGDEVERYVLARVLVAIMAQAALAHDRGVASREDIDIAMQFGVNYPRGPFEWSNAIGQGVCSDLLAALDSTTSDGRFRAPALA